MVKNKGAVPPPPTPRNRGSAIWSTDLNDGKILEIRGQFVAGWNIQQLAEKYETTWLTMSRIVKGLSWIHVQGPTEWEELPSVRSSRRGN
jgi:hypothetical protein